MLTVWRHRGFPGASRKKEADYGKAAEAVRDSALISAAAILVTALAPQGINSLVILIVQAFDAIRATGLGLLDTGLPKADLNQIDMILEPYRAQGILFHARRSRAAGTRRFVSFHVLVPGSWTVFKGHGLCEEIELAIRRALPETTVFTHLEPREDPVSFIDQALDRDPVAEGPSRPARAEEQQA